VAWVKTTLLSIFVSCEIRDYYRVVSVGKLGLTDACTACTTTEGDKQISFFSRSSLSIFESGGTTKHSMTGPFANSEFCFP